MKYLSFVVLFFFFSVPGMTSNSLPMAQIRMEPARLVTYELEDYFDEENEKHKNGSGLYAQFMPPNEVHIEINFLKDDKAFALWAQSKSKFWIEEIAKKYGIDTKKLSIFFREIQINP